MALRLKFKATIAPNVISLFTLWKETGNGENNEVTRGKR